MNRLHRELRRSSPISSIGGALGVAAMLMIGSTASAQQGSEIRLSRYTTGPAAPDAAQADPLEAVVQVSFPRAHVATVGDAVNYLLLRTGYRLAEPQEASSAARSLLALPLPEVHRQLGPYSVRTILSVLLGAAFTLSVDRVRRQVSYEVAASYALRGQSPTSGAPDAAQLIVGQMGHGQ